jgi:LPXTG-motif cell wall-anchored protein
MRAKHAAIAIALLGISAIGAVAPAGATQPDSDGEHKVWVCHATSGLGELKNGYNLIYVDVASTTPNGGHGENDHYGHSTTDPKDNSKFGVLYDYLAVDPSNLPGKCGTNIPDEPSKDPVETLVGSVPDCDTETVTDTYTVTTYSYTWDGTAWVESESTTTKEVERAMTEQELAACPTEESEGPVPPAPPTPVVQVAPATATPTAVTPTAATPTAATPAAPVATALPATGSEHWTILLIGLTSLLAGAGLLRLSRRPA